MNRCPICSVSLTPGLLMCKAHWFMVPVQLRDRIWGLYRTARGSDEHRAACYEAIKYVRAKVDGQGAAT